MRRCLLLRARVCHGAVSVVHGLSTCLSFASGLDGSGACSVCGHVCLHVVSGIHVRRARANVRNRGVVLSLTLTDFFFFPSRKLRAPCGRPLYVVRKGARMLRHDRVNLCAHTVVLGRHVTRGRAWKTKKITTTFFKKSPYWAVSAA